MNPEQLSAAARQWIGLFDTQAHRAIGAWREGGERLGDAARQRWDNAFAQSSARLSAETRGNATRARDAFAGAYVKGVALSATGAEAAIDTLVEAARTTVDRAAGWRQGRA